MDLKTNGSNVGSNNNSLNNNTGEAFGSQIVLREMEDGMCPRGCKDHQLTSSVHQFKGLWTLVINYAAVAQLV